MSLVSPINVLSARPWPTRQLVRKAVSMLTAITGSVTAPDAIDVVAGVDTHKDTHHVAVVTMTGGKLGDMQVPATPVGYTQLLEFVASFGRITLIGVEGTNSYGAGLARYLTASGVTIREVIRPKRAQRRRGKSDPIDAYAAAAQALAEPEALPVAKTSDGIVERIRVLLTARRSAVKARTAASRQIGSLLITAPDALRAKYARLESPELIETLAATRPGSDDSVATTTAVTLRKLARRHRYLTMEIEETDDDLRELVTRAAPALLAAKGVGVVTAATLLITAGDNPDRLRSESAFAALCGAAPIPASSGKTNRHRLNRGGDRQANWALHQIALVRIACDPRTKAYRARLTARGKSIKEIFRCLRRAIAREVYHLLVHPAPVPATHDLRFLRTRAGRTLWDAAHALATVPARISELERGLRQDRELTIRYRDWLLTA